LPTYSFPSGNVEILGAVTIEQTKEGVSPRRLPAWAERQVPDALMRFDVGAAAGIHLAFETEATSIQLEALFTQIDIAWTHLVPTSIELVVNGRLAETIPIVGGPIFRLEDDLSFSIRAGERSVIRFRSLEPGPKRLEIWLPHAALVELIFLTTSAVVSRPSPDTRPRWVHHGSSISHCLETQSPTSTWPAVAARRLGLAGVNLGFAGAAMFDPFVGKVIRDFPAELISVKMGVNVVGGQTLSPRGFLSAAHGYIDTIREKHPTTPLVIVSAIHCPLFETSSDDRPLSIQSTRKLLAQVVSMRADDPNLHYLDGRQLLGGDEAEMLPDDLHPNEAGYQRMGERFAAYIESSTVLQLGLPPPRRLHNDPPPIVL
jgi:hypothetical protein